MRKGRQAHLHRRHVIIVAKRALNVSRGHSEAQVLVAQCYENGVGLKQNKGAAKQWYQKAAGQGNQIAQSWIYDDGNQLDVLLDVLQQSVRRNKRNESNQTKDNDGFVSESASFDVNALNATIVFCNTIPSARAVEHFLREHDVPVAGYHGAVLPKVVVCCVVCVFMVCIQTREASFQSFMDGKKKVLVATDIASRGLDTTY